MYNRITQERDIQNGKRIIILHSRKKCISLENVSHGTQHAMYSSTSALAHSTESSGQEVPFV